MKPHAPHSNPCRRRCAESHDAVGMRVYIEDNSRLGILAAHSKRSPSPLPSPLPSPPGEGEFSAVSRKVESQRLPDGLAKKETARLLFPRLGGEGQGEGERHSFFRINEALTEKSKIRNRKSKIGESLLTSSPTNSTKPN